jgi:hypothetical protein
MRPRVAGSEGNAITAAAIGVGACAIALVGLGNLDHAVPAELRDTFWGLLGLVVVLLWAWDTEVAPADPLWYEHDGVF